MSSWYYASSDRKPVGPLTLEKLKELRREEVIFPDTYILEQTGEPGLQWKRYSEIFPSLPPLPPNSTPPALPQLPTPPSLPTLSTPPPLLPTLSPVPPPVPLQPVLPPGQVQLQAPLPTLSSRPLPPSVRPETDSWALGGFMMGISGIVLIFLCCGSGVILSCLGVVFSTVGLFRVLGAQSSRPGRGFAVAGLILSLVGILLVGSFLAYISSAAFDSSKTSTSETSDDH